MEECGRTGWCHSVLKCDDYMFYAMNVCISSCKESMPETVKGMKLCMMYAYDACL